MTLAHTPWTRRAPMALLGLLTALLLALALPGSARAHDTLIDSDPADGATVDGPLEKITLTYSADILDVSPLIRVTGPDGGMSQEVVPTIRGNTAVGAFTTPLTDGEHDIRWRVVSSDGHPIEGVVHVKVTNAPAAASDGGAGEQPSDAGDGAGSVDKGSTEPASQAPSQSTPAPAEQASGSSVMPWVLGGVVGVAVVAVAVAVLLGRSRRNGV